MEEFSSRVSYTMDKLGYNAEIIRFRRSYWQEDEKLCNGKISLTGTRLVVAGSKAEGITSVFESDIDCMYILENVICSENIELLTQQPLTVLQLETQNAPPGYAMLRLCSRRVFGSPEMAESLYHTPSGDIYAASSLFQSSLHKHVKVLQRSKGIQGPAFQFSHVLEKKDIVHALHCISPDSLHSFKSRLRQSDWPPLDVLTDDSTATCQLVPVGMKGSGDQWMEWRFCFIKTELKLTHSFNDTQLKMYIILKFVAKDILTAITTEISSYIMKNVVYWISEFHGRNVFREENLVQLVLLGLHFLMMCVKGNNLPYYMIPERNLLAERLERHSRRQILELLSQLLKEGPRLFLRMNKLKMGLTVMYTSPSSIEEYRKQKDQREMQHLICEYLLTCKLHGRYDGRELPALVVNLLSSVFPEIRNTGMRHDDLIYMCRHIIEHLTPENGENVQNALSNPAFRDIASLVMKRMTH